MLKKFGVVISCAVVLISIAPTTSHAQVNVSSLAAGAGSCAIGNFISSKITSAVNGLFSGGASSVTSTVGASTKVPVVASDTDSRLNMVNQKLAAEEQKNFTLDRLASCAAKQLLHQMTADTISWINSGFRGGPAFLQNPRGFLLDTADQLTGVMIGNNGLLQGLCSPWNIDIRLKLALETTGGDFDNRRYTCTLNTIIGQAQNATLDGFIGGDFKQGGWRAFMEMTAGSQNPAMQYLLAKSQLQGAVNKATKAVNDELAQGMGFLSSEKCTNVVYDNIGQVNAGEIFEYANIQANPDGTYKQCVKTTPGSVIANALNVHTNSGIVEAELANDINSVTSALFTQLTNQMLQQGLTGLSSNMRLTGRTNLNSSISQLQAAAYAPQTVVSSGGSIYTVQNGTVTQTGQTPTNEVMNAYIAALDALGSTKSNYTQARNCFDLFATSNPSNQNVTEAQNQRAAIDTIMTAQVDPLIASTTAAQASVSSQTIFTPADISKAQSALTNAQVWSSQLDLDAQGFLTACQNLNNAN